MGKYVFNQIVARFLRRLMAEVRHRPIAFCGAGQTVDDLPYGMPGLLTTSFLFSTPSPRELRQYAQLIGGHDGLRHDQVQLQEVGEARAHSVRSNAPDFVRGAPTVYLRPGCADVGGQTVQAAPQGATPDRLGDLFRC